MIEILNLRIKKKLSSRIIEILFYFITYAMFQYFIFDMNIGRSIFSGIFFVVCFMFIINPILNRWEDWLDKRAAKKNIETT